MACREMQGLCQPATDCLPKTRGEGACVSDWPLSSMRFDAVFGSYPHWGGLRQDLVPVFEHLFEMEQEHNGPKSETWNSKRAWTSRLSVSHRFEVSRG